MTIDKEKEKLFTLVRSKLGAPVRKIQLTDDQLCDFLELAVGNYAEKVQSFIIENNWANLYGKNMSNTDLAYALSVRTMDMSKDYSNWFSKQVGLQGYNSPNGSNWELKKDFFQLEKGRQVYVVPAGRQINKVLWITPPTVDQAKWGAYGGLGIGFGGGTFAQTGIGAAMAFGGLTGGAMGVGVWALPAYDIAALATDLKAKNQIFRGELSYKVTAGPDGTQLIHLMSTPGSPFTFGAGGVGMLGLHNCYCWYTYYDVTPENVDDCRKANPDVILSPDQVPLEEMDFAYLNAPTKALVRRLLIGEAAETLGITRGTFSGSINMLASPLTMDYQMLINMGQNEKKEAMQDLEKRLERLSPAEMLKRQAEMTQSITEIKRGVPLGLYVR